MTKSCRIVDTAGETKGFPCQVARRKTSIQIPNRKVGKNPKPGFPSPGKLNEVRYITRK